MYTSRSSLIQQREKTSYGRMIISRIRKIGAISKKVYAFVRSHKNMMTMMIPICIAVVGGALYFLIRTILLHHQFTQDPSKLLDMSIYTHTTEDIQAKYSDIYAAIEGFQELSETLQRYNQYVRALQTPYTYLLQHSLLPSLFIREDPYTQEIDTTLVGRRFIQQNPFTDTALIQYWSNFFRNVGDGTDFVLVRDIQLGSLQEGPKTFTIPITVSFTAPSKRAFLLLVDKLSLTSQEATISLINQFFFHLWNVIYDTIDDDIQDPNNHIGQSLYQWVFHDQETDLVTTDILWQAIQETAQCQLLNTQACLYNFRSIYRSIPQLAYGVGLTNDQASIRALQRFLQDLPPVITIQDFSFQRMPARTATQSPYQGTVVIHMHGRSVQDEQVDQVAYLLGRECLGTNDFLSPDLAAETIDTYLRRIADTQLAQQQSTQLLQLRRLIADNQNTFDDLSNYNKVIRLFEIQRMLSDAGICR